MKTRIVHTKFWQDNFILSLSKDARYLYSYLLSCPHVNICGIFELPEQYLLLETGLTLKELQKAQEQLKPKVLFYNGWICVKNILKYNNYIKSADNKKAYNKELALIPIKIKEFFDSSVYSTVGSDPTVTIIHKSEIINNKYRGIVKGGRLKDITKEQIQQISKDYKVPIPFVLSKIDDIKNYCASTGKTYKNYIATLRHWVKKDSINLKTNQKRGGVLDARNIV